MFIKVDQNQNGTYTTDVDNIPCKFQYYYGVCTTGSGEFPVFGDKPVPAEGTSDNTPSLLVVDYPTNPTIIDGADVSWNDDGCGTLYGISFNYDGGDVSVSFNNSADVISVYTMLSPAN